MPFCKCFCLSFWKSIAIMISGFSLFLCQLGMHGHELQVDTDDCPQQRRLVGRETWLRNLIDFHGRLVHHHIFYNHCGNVRIQSESAFFTSSSLKVGKRDLKKRRLRFKVYENVAIELQIFILTLAYGMNIGIFNAFSTLLNSIVLHYFSVSILRSTWIHCM